MDRIDKYLTLSHSTTPGCRRGVKATCKAAVDFCYSMGVQTTSALPDVSPLWLVRIEWFQGKGR